MSEIRPIPPFKRFCGMLGAFPEAFSDAMSVYESLEWLYHYISTEIVPKTNEAIKLAEELKEYVEHYFDNLDVQEEINNKLDAMAESGELAEIIAAYLQVRSVLAYDSIEDMKEATNLTDGSFVETYGFYSKGDGGGAKYKVRQITNEDDVDEITLFALIDATLVAELVVENSTITTKQFGIKGDGTDETDRMLAFFAYDATKYILNSPTILIDDDMPVTSNSEVVFDGCKLMRKSTDLEHYYMLLIDGVHDVIVRDAFLVGDRVTHSGDGGEWGHGIAVFCSQNVTIENCYIEQTWGDGIYIGLYSVTGATDQVENVKVSGCHIYKCSRNGISVCSGENIFIDNCHIEYTDRINPKDGIDIETEGPSGSTPTLENVKITNIKTNNNGNHGIAIYCLADYVVRGLEIDNHYSYREVGGLSSNAFDNAANTGIYKNAYIELASDYALNFGKRNTNTFIVRNVTVDSAYRSDPAANYYGIVNVRNSDTSNTGGGLIIDNVIGVQNHVGEGYSMFKTVIVKNNSTSGRIENITLMNTNKIKAHNESGPSLMYLNGSNYDYSTIKLINCENEFVSSYNSLDFTSTYRLFTKITKPSLDEYTFPNITLVDGNLPDGVYSMSVGDRNGSSLRIDFDSDYSVWRGEDNSTDPDYRRFTSNYSGSYLEFEKVGSNIYILNNRGFTSSQIA